MIIYIHETLKNSNLFLSNIEKMGIILYEKA